jgi:hypothetical protein
LQQQPIRARGLPTGKMYVGNALKGLSYIMAT